MANSIWTPFIKKGGAALFKRLLNGTIGYEPGMGWYWRCVIDFAKTPGMVGAVAMDADTSSTIDLHTAFPRNLFPANVTVHGATLYQESILAAPSLSAATVSLGDVAAGTGLLNAVNVFVGTGLKGTQGAESVFHTEAAFIPQIIIATTGANGNALNGGRFSVRIFFTPHPTYA